MDYELLWSQLFDHFADTLKIEKNEQISLFIKSTLGKMCDLEEEMMTGR